jgi:LCP family protein required for cell wall assembly
MGLVMLLVVMVAGHTIVGYWDIRFYNLARDIHQDVVIETPSPDASDTPEPTITFPPQETIAPAATVKPWSGTDRLNILLVGADTRSGYRTDSTIVVSIDPVTHQVAMFSILRDALGLPMPPKSRLSQCFGTNFNEILTNLWERAEQRCKSLFPHGGSDALKQALGYTFFGNQNAIQYYIAVSFSGFEKIVDTLGGVTINVPAPVVDDTFPSNTSDHIHVRVYVPAGIQHMDGNQALTYSRMGHATFGSSNYLRAQRQQQVVVAIEQQVNFDEISSNLSSLVDTLGSTVKTDIPEGPDVLAPLINLARTVKQSDIRAIVWAGSRPNYATIRATVKSWLTPSKASSDLQAALGENAPILVQNGTGIANQDTSLASFLQGMGLNAQASAEQPAQLGGPLTILCLNGAETEFPATLTELKATLGLTGTPSTDPTSDVRLVTKLGDPVQFVVVTGTGMPALTTPPG